jgi:hypothetical protein
MPPRRLPPVLFRCYSSPLVCWLVLQVAGSPTASALPTIQGRRLQKPTSAFAAPPITGKQRERSRFSSTSSLAAAKMQSPAAERNKELIWNVLHSNVLQKMIHNGLPTSTSPTEVSTIRILEVAGGAGVHMHHIALQLMLQQEDSDDSKTPISYHFQPTDPTVPCRASQVAYIDELQSLSKDAKVSVATPLQLTLDESGILELETAAQTARDNWDVIVCINMIHISPWSATLGLMQMAGALLRPGSGYLYLYGPYRVNGTCVESNRYV